VLPALLPTDKKVPAMIQSNKFPSVHAALELLSTPSREVAVSPVVPQVIPVTRILVLVSHVLQGTTEMATLARIALLANSLPLPLSPSAKVVVIIPIQALHPFHVRPYRPDFRLRLTRLVSNRVRTEHTGQVGVLPLVKIV
jgi:hypothetical protein